MSANKRLTAATGLAGVGIGGLLVAALENLGYFQSISQMLPQSVRQALMSERNLLIFAAVAFLFAIGLLWSVAWSSVRNAALARESNAKAWSFEPTFLAFQEETRETLQRIEDALAALRNESAEANRSAQNAHDEIHNCKLALYGEMDEFEVAARTASDIANQLARAVEKAGLLEQPLALPTLEGIKATRRPRP